MVDFRLGCYPPETGHHAIQQYRYRIYCPTRMVRNVTSNRWDDARTDAEEDEVNFSGASVLRTVVMEACEFDL